MRTYVHSWVRKCILRQMRINTHTYIHTWVYTCIHTCMRAFMNACMHILIHIYVYTYIHTYVWFSYIISITIISEQLHDCFGKKAPKILRIYSEELERQVFPIPREAPVRVGHGRRFELIGSEEQKEVALHYLIRKRGKKFSEKIAEYDKLFRKNMGSHYNVDDNTIER